MCSTAKVNLVRALGADHVIDYTRDDLAAGSQRYHLILDIGGNSPLPLLRRALAPSGTLVLVGGEDGDRWTGGLGRQLRAVALSPFVRQRLTMKTPREHYADLERLARLIDAGELTPTVDKTYPLDQAPEAMRHLEAGQAGERSSSQWRRPDESSWLTTPPVDVWSGGRPWAKTRHR